MNGSNYSQMSIQSKGADERRKEIEALKIHNISMVFLIEFSHIYQEFSHKYFAFPERKAKTSFFKAKSKL